MKKTKAQHKLLIAICLIVLVPALLYNILSAVFWFRGMPKIFFDYTVKEDNTVSVDFYKGFFPYVKIPDTIDGMPVSEINNFCFSILKGLHKDNHTAFDVNGSRFRNIYEIHIPDSVERIGNYAFDDCNNLKKINMPANLKYTGTHILLWTDVTELVFPEGITQLGIDNDKTPKLLNGQYSFCGTQKLKKVVLPSTLKTIGGCTFSENPSLKEIELPDGLEEIGYGAFWDTGIEKIDIPGSVSYLGGGAFEETPYIKQLRENTQGDFIIFNNTILYEYLGNIDENGDIIIPDGIIQISEGAFVEVKFRSAVIPDSVKYMNKAFSGSYIQYLDIPDSVDTKGEFCIGDCPELREVILPEGMTEIDRNMFSGCESLESVKIPEGVTEIGENAFYECKALKTITIPKSVTTIKDNAFENCYSLETVDIQGEITDMGKYVFKGCDNMKDTDLRFTLNNADEYDGDVP